MRRLLRLFKSLLLATRTRIHVHQLQLEMPVLLEKQNTIYRELTRLGALEQRLLRMDSTLVELFEVVHRRENALKDQIATHTKQFALVASLLDRVAQSAGAKSAAPHPAAISESAVLKNFYVMLENRFRGAPGDIAQRQTIYLPDVERACADTGLRTILDLGCGRGEWLRLAADAGLQGIGVDTNEGQLNEARQHGLSVTECDGLAFLRAQPDGRFPVVTAFHLFEHLPFAILAEWMVEIARVLCPGGVLIAETPNPENLLVGAFSFHLDPTHVRPLPSGLLSILAETVGLQVRRILPLHVHERLAEAQAQLPEPIPYLLFGHQDYGLIAERPASSQIPAAAG